MTFEVDTNIPIPEKRLGRQRVYPFGDMEVGHSFAVRGDDPVIANRVAAAASYYGKRKGKKFSVLKISDTHHRCWRVA